MVKVLESTKTELQKMIDWALSIEDLNSQLDDKMFYNKLNDSDITPEFIRDEAEFRYSECQDLMNDYKDDPEEYKYYKTNARQLKKFLDYYTDERIEEMKNNPIKKRQRHQLTKGQAWEICKEVMLSNLSVAYYKFEEHELPNGKMYDDLSDKEKELINKTMQYMGEKMAKSIGGNYYTQ